MNEQNSQSEGRSYTSRRSNGGRDRIDSQRPRRKKRRYQLMRQCSVAAGIALAILIFIIVIIVLICRGCSGASDSIIGKWDVDGTTFYEFYDNGNGTMILPGASYGFTYTIEEDQIHIDYTNESVRDGSYAFSVDGDKMILAGGEGTIGGTYELTRIDTDE